MTDDAKTADIVTRLRECPPCAGNSHILGREAAEEIDRLWAENERRRRAMAATVAACRQAHGAFRVPMMLRDSIDDLERANGQ